MLRDVFYYGKKPNIHPREKPAKDFEEARYLATTEHFWIINEFCNYINFDWDFDFDMLDDHDQWQQDHINVWPSQHQKDSGTWLCSKKSNDFIIYRTDVDPIKRENIKSDNWVILENIDEKYFDFSWHPDPTSPPYIYKFGCRFYPATTQAVLEYHVPGATEDCYMDVLVELKPEFNNWIVYEDIDRNLFDFTWRPDPASPPYIYVWGNQHYPGTIMPTVEYHVPGATEKKYVDQAWHAKLINKPQNFKIFEDFTDFDFSWVPDPTSPPYIYVWGNQWNSAVSKISVVYEVHGAEEYKYMNTRVKRLPDKTNWIIPSNIDENKFDFSWEPDPNDPPFIYQFGTQHQKTGGPKFVVSGATDVKFISNLKARAITKTENWKINNNLNIDFDFSWHPDETEEPFIHVFGNQYYKAEIMPTVEYHTPKATQIKYNNLKYATVKTDKSNWYIPHNIDISQFDLNWFPNINDEPYTYEWNTQWQKNGGPKYIVPNSTETKYMFNPNSKSIPYKDNWEILEDIDLDSFDFSWHPDNTEEPFVYVFGNQHHNAEVMPTVRYNTPGATQIKYINEVKANLAVCENNWFVPDNVDVTEFDFSWCPDPLSPPFIYQFGTQWQKTGGPTYTVEGATEVKYIDSQKAVRLSDKSNWIIPDDLDVTEFDFSWHPDDTEPAFIYEFGTQHQKTDGPRYVVEGLTDTKYINVQHAKRLPNLKHWFIPDNIDKNSFDFSWHPDNTEEPYDYEFATIWNDLGGPVYRMHGSNQKKYIKNIQAKTLPDKKNYDIKLRLEPNGFDFSWTPHPDAPPYIYVFGNQWNRAEKETTIEYHVPGSTEYKYVDDIIAKVAQDKSNFEILRPIIENDFDFSWRPDPYDDPFIYVFGNTQYPGEVMPTVRYVVRGATEIKYVDIIKAKLSTNMKNWFEHIKVDKARFDFSWVPDPLAPPYIYVFGNQWNNATTEPTLEYRVPGATEYKYIEDTIAYVLPDKSNFTILHPIIEDSFDFSWRPNPKEDPYIYAFGNSQYPAEKMPTVLYRKGKSDLPYRLSGATKYKYDHSQKATLAQNYDKFTEIIPVDRVSFNYSWVPDPHDDPYIYVFGNQWNSSEIEPTLEYRVKGATQRKYMTECVNVLPDYTKWHELIKVRNNFDYSWRPDPTSPPYIYVFGNQWNSSEIEPTLEYVVEGATERKYINDIIAEVASDMTNWVISEGINTDDFDFSWRPNPGSPPYIYQFGTIKDDNDGPKYIHPKHTGEIVYKLRVKKFNKNSLVEIPKYFIETSLEDLIEKHPNEVFWACNKNINYSNFDFSWRPNIEQVRYVQVFGSPEAKETQTYFVSAKLYKQGFKNFNFINQDLKIENEYLAETFISPDMFFVDRGNKDSLQRFEQLKERFPNIKKARYLQSWTDTIYRCLNKCDTQLAWILSSEYDYSNFDFKYYPNPWQLDMVHVFGTQWNQWGNTYIVNKEKFFESTKYVKTIEHLKNLNFVKNKIAKITNCLHDVYLIDHSTTHTQNTKQQIEKKIGKNVEVILYNTDYLTTLKDLLNKLPSKYEHYIWVCSSICNYELFDFSFAPDFYSKENLYVFSSNKQKFGDTFLIDVNKMRSLINDLDLLRNYSKISFVNYVKVSRLNPPVFEISDDTHTLLSSLEFDFPYAIFKTHDNNHLKVDYQEPMSLWDPTTKNLEVLSTGASLVAIPKEVQNFNREQLYNYPYIITSKSLQKSHPLDIVFLSNGEKCADENYEHLLKISKKLSNRVVRVDGIYGRVKAYRAAARASNTPWLFTVFAKLKVDENFDFNWQPDRLQKPKHYIFHAKNPLNGLVYGHQAIIAYNKKLTLANRGIGLDFTLDDPHSVVTILSGIANFNTDKFSTWRTAFREVIKLKSDYDPISIERLNTWLTIANGDFAKECLQGANDAAEYYDKVDGDIDQLKLSYEWGWLLEYYNRKYK